MRLRHYLVLVAFVAGCGGTEQTMNSDVATPVTVQEIALQPIDQYITATGTVVAAKSVVVKSEISGFYAIATNPATGRPYKIGDSVKSGAVLFELTNPEEDLAIQLDIKQLDLETAKSDYEQQKTLYDLGGVTPKELRNSETSVKNAQNTYETALIRKKRQTPSAPMDGIITAMPYYAAGLKIDSGSELATIMEYRTLLVDINLPGKILGDIKEGMPVKVANYTVPDSTIEGRVTKVSPILDGTTRTFAATITVDNQKSLIRPGMFVQASIVVDHRDSTIVIPKDLVMARRNERVVFVVERGAAFERRIQLGIENQTSVEVISGLNPADRLVIEGYETLRDNAKVTINQ